MADIDEELAALEAAEKAATPGPWESGYKIGRDPQHRSLIDDWTKGGADVEGYGELSTTFVVKEPADAALIAAARNALPWLIPLARKALRCKCEDEK